MDADKINGNMAPESQPSTKTATLEMLFNAIDAQAEPSVRRILLEFRRRRVKWVQMKHKRTGDTPLHVAARRSSLLILEMLRNYCHPNEEDRSECNLCYEMLEIPNNLRRTILHEAVMVNRAAVVGYLLKQGAKVDSLMEGTWTPLMLACSKTGIVAFQSVRILLENGANPLLQNKDGWTPLHLACRTGWPDTVNILLHYKPEAVEFCSNNGRTPLHLAALHGHNALVQTLLQANSPVDPIDDCGLTPLHEAVRGGHIQVIRTLKRHGTKLHKVDKNGFSCLHFAAETGRTNVIEFLLVECCMYVDAPSKIEKLTALHCAVRSGQTNCVKTLLSFGADPTKEDAKGREALDLCSGLNIEEMQDLLEDEQKQIQPFRQNMNPNLQVAEYNGDISF